MNQKPIKRWRARGKSVPLDGRLAMLVGERRRKAGTCGMKQKSIAAGSARVRKSRHGREGKDARRKKRIVTGHRGKERQNGDEG